MTNSNSLQCADPFNIETPSVDVGAPFSVLGHKPDEIPLEPAQGPIHTLIEEIREQHRWRICFHKAEKSLINQCKSQCRRVLSHQSIDAANISAVKKEAEVLYKAIGGKGEHPLAEMMRAFLAPAIESRDLNHKARLHHEKTMTQLARELPVFQWVETVHGFGPLGLAQIIGEAGNLSHYPNPAKLWKRMGMAVIEGKAQRRVANAEQAALHGFNPRRRSIMFCIGDSLIKAKNPYRELYLERKQVEAEKLPESDGGRKIIWHLRAQRYTEKRLLRDLWKAWRKS